jgi:hypothetical protein
MMFGVASCRPWRANFQDASERKKTIVAGVRQAEPAVDGINRTFH